MDDLFKHIPQQEASYSVASQATYYPDFVRIFIPNHPFQKLKSGFELVDKTEILPNGETLKSETNVERSLRRTRKLIKDYVFCNNFDLFVTFTFNCKKCRQGCKGKPCTCNDKCLRFNPGICKSRMANWLKNEKKRKGKFEYVIVSEYHKDKKALHFHAVIKGYPGYVNESLNEDGSPKIIKGRQRYQLPSYTIGYTDARFIEQNRESYSRVAWYIQKYIIKDMVVVFGKNRYWASQGLKKPTIEYNPEPFYENIKPSWEFKNEYGTIMEFNAGSHPLIDIFLEAKK